LADKVFQNIAISTKSTSALHLKKSERVHRAALNSKAGVVTIHKDISYMLNQPEKF
jgi:hypothetical protein